MLYIPFEQLVSTKRRSSKNLCNKILHYASVRHATVFAWVYLKVYKVCFFLEKLNLIRRAPRTLYFSGNKKKQLSFFDLTKFVSKKVNKISKLVISACIFDPFAYQTIQTNNPLIIISLLLFPS